MSWEPFQVRVPASTSNLGPGFDTLSAALSLHLTIGVESIEGAGVEWPPDWSLPLEENVLDRSLRTAFSNLGAGLPAIRLSIDNPIPLTRGLGSSGAAIIAGIKIAEQITGERLSDDDALRIAFPLEGHPDNLAASLLGGWVLSWTSGSRVHSLRLRSALRCRFVVAVPDQAVSTPEARAILPGSYDLAAAVFNIQRSSLLVHALHSGEARLLREATLDRLHQPYRASLVPGLAKVLSGPSRNPGWSESLLGTFISGSGSTVIALADGREAEIGAWMIRTLAAAGTPAQLRVLDLDLQGARIEGSASSP